MISTLSKKEKLQREQIFHSLFLLRVIITNSRLYSMDNPKTRENIAQAYATLKKTLQAIQTLTILIIDNDIIINNKAVRAEEAKHFSLFITVLKQKDIGHIAFQKNLTLEELRLFLTDLATLEKTEVYSGPGISCGVLGLKEESAGTLAAPDLPASPKEAGTISDSSQAIEARLKSLSSKQLRMAQELFYSIRQEQGFDIRGVQDVMSSFVSLFSSTLNPLSILTTLKGNDEYTFTHVINACILTLAQAESLGFRDQHLYEIGVAATLYDIGKTFIPKEILNKGKPLDRNEKKIVMQHAMKGASYLLTIDDAPPLAVLAALEHHIRFGGGGYPNIGKEWKTNIVSQMISIADTYDAMRCGRPYRKAISETRICEMLQKDNGNRYNPYLVKNFLKILQRNRRVPGQS